MKLEPRLKNIEMALMPKTRIMDYPIVEVADFFGEKERGQVIRNIQTPEISDDDCLAQDY